MINNELKMHKQQYSPLPIILIIAGLYAAGTYLHYLMKLFLVEPNFGDFASYYFLGAMLNRGINLFTISQPALDNLRATFSCPVYICGGEVVAFYSPFFYSIFKLISKLDFNIANLIWAVLNNSALILSIFFLMKIIKLKINVVNLSLASIITFLYQPLIENVGIGQANLLILCMLVLTLWSLISSRTILAGFFLAITILIKPHYGLILLLLLIRQLYKPFWATIFFYCFLSLLSTAVVGWELQRDYLPLLLSETPRVVYSPECLTWVHNLSFPSALARLLNGKYINILRIIYIIFAAGVLLFTVIQFKGKFKKENFALEFAWLTSLIVFLAPVLEEHYLVILYLPIFVVFSKMDYLHKSEQYIFIFGFLLTALRYSLVSFEVFNHGLISLFSNGKLYGLMLILTGILLSYKRFKKAEIA